MTMYLGKALCIDVSSDRTVIDSRYPAHRDDGLSVLCFELSELATIRDPGDDLFHIKALLRVRWYNGI